MKRVKKISDWSDSRAFIECKPLNSKCFVIILSENGGKTWFRNKRIWRAQYRIKLDDELD